MYRAVTLYLLRNDIPLSEVKTHPYILDNIKIDFKFNQDNDFFETYMNGVSVENLIRKMDVANYVSEVSALKEIRDFLYAQQRRFGKNKGVVMDGRDIGTKVFPDAELKIFMTANPVIRAKRRFQELQQKQIPVSYEEVLDNIQKRDEMDTNRIESPLVRAEDAIILDNSNMGIEEQSRVALTWAKGVIALS